MNRIVLVGDGETYFPGEVVEDNVALRIVAEGNMATLPVEPELLKRNGASGFVMRHFGHGWQFDPTRPGRGCPIVFYADPDFPVLHWAACLAPDGSEARGVLRLSADSGQEAAMSVGLRSDDAVDLRTLGLERRHVVGGSASFAAGGGSRFIGLGIYGAAGGFRVRWLAITQTR